MVLEISKIRLLSVMLRLLAIAGVCVIGIHFRTFPLRPHMPTIPKEAVRNLLQAQIKEQFRKGLESQFPNLDESVKLKFAEEKMQEAIRLDRDKFQELVTAAEKNFSKRREPGHSRHYLQEADPYFFYYLAKEIEKNGTISPEQKNGKFFMALREIPKGAWAMMTWHPYAGYVWHCFLRSVKVNVDLMESLCYFPLFAFVVAVFAFFFLSSTIGVDFPSGFLGAIAFALAPIFIERTTFGWFDTDSYQYIFPFLILACFFKSLEAGGKRLTSFLWLLGSGFLTGLYSLFWAGWLFILFILAFSGILISFWGYWHRKVWWSDLSRLTVCYIILSVSVACIFITPAGLWYMIYNGCASLFQFTRTDSGLWPNAFLTVGEAMPTSIPKLIYLSGNPVGAGLVCLGLIASPFIFWLKGKDIGLFEWIVFVLLLMMTVAVSLNTERFSILVVIPVSVFTAYGTFWLMGFIQQFVQSLSKGRFNSALGRTAAFAVVATLIFPYFIFARATALHGGHLIMNDTWYESLQALKEKTPKDAIVNGWWPPGYFVVALAERGVLMDGGTQQLPQTYWMAKALLAPEEKETLGMLRMLNESGNDALELLLARGTDLELAVKLILQAVSMSKKDAEQILPLPFGGEDRVRFMNMVYGTENPKPAYLFLYNDLIEQNLAMSIMANWDFGKAKQLREAKRKRAAQISLMVFANRSVEVVRRYSSLKKGLVYFSGKVFTPWFLQFNERSRTPSSARFSKYLDDVLTITGEVWKYTPKGNEIGRAGSRVSFSNGLTVDLETMDATITLGDEKILKRPKSIWYVRDGSLVERKFEENRLDVSALLIREEGRYAAVLAHPDLIRSTIFRLYYLKGGEAIRFFKPFFLKDDPITRTSIGIFEVNWKQFQEEEAMT